MFAARRSDVHSFFDQTKRYRPTVLFLDSARPVDEPW